MPLKRPRNAEPTRARMDAFARGEIWGLHSAGVPREEIRARVVKQDGTAPGLHAIDMVTARKSGHPEWRGVVRAGGRRPSLTTAQQKELVDLVFAERGRAKVTVKYCKQRLPFLRLVNRLSHIPH